jgi:hypothetical protein
MDDKVYELKAKADHRAMRHSGDSVQAIPPQSSNQYHGNLTWQHQVSSLSANSTQNRIHRVRAPEYLQNAAVVSGIPSVGLLTEKPMPDSLTISGHSWTRIWVVTIGVNEYYAVVRRYMPAHVAKSRLFLIFTAASPEHSGATGL